MNSPIPPTAQFVRVVRSDGTVESDKWTIWSVGDRRILMSDKGETKSPGNHVFECWQRGGMCVNSSDHMARCKK